MEPPTLESKYRMLNEMIHLRSLWVNELLSFAASPRREELTMRIWLLKSKFLMSIFSLKPLSFFTASLG